MKTIQAGGEGRENGSREGKLAQKTDEIPVSDEETLQQIEEPSGGSTRQGAVLLALSVLSRPVLAPTASASSGFMSTSFTAPPSAHGRPR